MPRLTLFTDHGASTLLFETRVEDEHAEAAILRKLKELGVKPPPDGEIKSLSTGKFFYGHQMYDLYWVGEDVKVEPGQRPFAWMTYEEPPGPDWDKELKPPGGWWDRYKRLSEQRKDK